MEQRTLKEKQLSLLNFEIEKICNDEISIINIEKLHKNNF
jgi:hypothetical protein